MDIALWTHRVDFRRANEEAILWLTFHAADFMIDLDVPFFVDFEDIPPKFLFHLHDSLPLDLE
jgi:hypothetical protein